MSASNPATTLYRSGYRPARLAKKYEPCSVTISGDGQAADIMRRKGVPDEWGEPVDAVGFFDDGSGDLVALTADYANGRRAEYRRTGRQSKLSFTQASQ